MDNEMLTSECQPQLPPEILLYIIENCIIRPSNPPIAFPPNHLTTKTHLSLARTCRAAYAPALRVLYNHCLYIDSPDRLRALLSSVEVLSARRSDTSQSSLPIVHYNLTSLFLSPFPEDTIDDLPVVKSLHSLLTLLAPTLTHWS
jgi:hypothetical protein